MPKIGSQIREFGNWERGRAVSFLGIHKLDLVCSAAVVLTNEVASLQEISLRLPEITGSLSKEFVRCGLYSNV